MHDPGHHRFRHAADSGARGDGATETFRIRDGHFLSQSAEGGTSAYSPGSAIQPRPIATTKPTLQRTWSIWS